MNLTVGLALVILIVSIAPMVRANDGVMGGAGSDLVPMKETDVSMVSEDILLTYDAEYWYVEADYAFRNNAKTAQALQLGFPEYRCEVDEADCLAARSFHFEDMVTSVRGTPVKHRKGRVKSEHAWAPRLGNVWLFDLKMAPEEQVNVRHTYRVPASYDSIGARSTRYVTRTGALWAGPIGNARFRVRVPLQAVDFNGPDELKRTAVSKLEIGGRKLAEVLYEIRDFSPDFDLSFYFIERHGVAAADSGRPDLTPEGPARSGLADRERCQNFVGLWELGQDKAAGRSEHAMAELRTVLAHGTNSRSICEATVYAKYGKRFDDDRFNRYFYGASGFRVGEWPYGFMRPNPDFDPSWLGPDDLATLELIRRLPEDSLIEAVQPAEAQDPEPRAQETPARGAGGCNAVRSPVQGATCTAALAGWALLLLKRRGRARSPRRLRSTCLSRLGR